MRSFSGVSFSLATSGTLYQSTARPHNRYPASSPRIAAPTKIASGLTDLSGSCFRIGQPPEPLLLYLSPAYARCLRFLQALSALLIAMSTAIDGSSRPDVCGI